MFHTINIILQTACFQHVFLVSCLGKFKLMILLSCQLVSNLKDEEYMLNSNRSFQEYT